MNGKAMEDRLKALEEEVARLRAELTMLKRLKDPRSTYGMFTGDEVMKRIDEETLKIRERDREKARRRFSRAKKTKA